MNAYQLTPAHFDAFEAHLRREERGDGTVAKYLRDVRAFARWLDGAPVTRERAADWKEHLLCSGYSPVTVNSMLAALNAFFVSAGWAAFRVKALRLQRCAFQDESRFLSRAEYARLLAAAHGLGRDRLALLLETICSTGIRVSEVRYITVEAARQGRVQISLKGKIRVILLPTKLCRKLLKYAKKQKIASGEIFLTKSGKSLSRRQIWSEMKALCARSGVAPSKVFPHNLRRLFARTFYKVSRDLTRLADVLGHSSVETTHIYLLSNGAEHAAYLARMGLVS